MTYSKIYDPAKMTCEHRMSRAFFQHTVVSMYAMQHIDREELKTALDTDKITILVKGVANTYKVVEG